MKNYIYKKASIVFLSGVLIAGFVGCSSFLEEQDPSNLTPDSFYTIPDHAEAALAAVYADTRFIGGGSGIFSVTWQLLEAPTGTSTTETAQNSDLNNLYGLIYDGRTQHVINWWNGLYRVIAQANLVLDKVPSITPMDESQKTKVLGEARFLRAWAYFYAVRLWGDIPLITTPQTASSEDFRPSPTSQQEIYALIIEDLKAAEAAGLPWMDESGRASLAATKSLLSKVYLTMAGFPLNMGTSHYQLAADKSKEVVDYANSNPVSINLFPTYKAIHNENNDNKLEHIFMLQYNVIVAGNPMNDMFPNFKPVTFAGPSGTGSTVPTEEFYASFEPGDKRAVNQEGFFYTTYYTNGSGAEFDLGAPYIFKHFNQIALGSKDQPGTRANNLNVPLIRFAEVLLIYAEAQNEVGGPNVLAVESLTRIRDRAGLSTPSVGGFTKDTFRDAVYRERWHELCYEQITWFDMIRLRKVYNEGTNGFDQFEGHVNPSSNQALQARHYLMPFPLPEMQNNPNLTPQNPGY
ncbi:RagB/SusD family nutrient uptake outer membrane protein [Algoriphagus sp. NG3]|uniref:RagB/SusD family nutrient uptake outer membrane protein n=1 Tax=Algoriphagus sp. NG3 TaxID=3097546 RepID=UPI002A83BDF3|nr:RagB/SusD family nutrient uptake outer membrane protein [Algoriphagus sp. NG3]WPR76142.1 RagB/SusD family nutrient uptake outer membrane protein [Algoriphagus sp. NG3]